MQKVTFEEKQAMLEEARKTTKQYDTTSQSGESNLNSRQELCMDKNYILELVRNFHRSVSTGPIYVCSCCDQLWYKHSVSPANLLRIINPDIQKYLQNKKSVDNIEGLCQTQKPDFFYLNELECRLIAPRLAFQKIFQAPTGGQLKITGNGVNFQQMLAVQ